jgi:penicillin-binding protein 2
MYIGYAPYENPEISISVTIENAGGGGSNAAPLAREVMDFYFERSAYKKVVDTSAEQADQVVVSASGGVNE